MYKIAFKDLEVGDPLYYIKRSIDWKELTVNDIDSVEILGLARGRKSTVLKTSRLPIPSWRFPKKEDEITVYNRATIAYFSGVVISADLFELTRLIKKNKGTIGT